ncbi:hypothetical protein ABT369_33235 [Dactylosporangium sp. NPDC000244]|uniref:hypothetical protein n=1 Tax=Dactylosporangium sp. NPDC000244 TaxID=3154365 RepID=UPI00331922BE
MDQARQYPVVRTGADAGPRLEWENWAVLFVLQASQGLIGPEILGISVEAGAEEIIVHVCLREDGEPVAEDLDDLVSEFDAVQAGIVEPPARLIVAKYLGTTDPRWPGYAHPRIYLASDRMRDACVGENSPSQPIETVVPRTDRST